MKRISEFKGYRSVTEFDPASGTFVQVRFGIAGFQEKKQGQVLPFVERPKLFAVRKNAKKIWRETLV